jgi:carbamoyltransferase
LSQAILGIALGHDASATVLLEGRIASYVLRERHSRIRHHYGIDRRTIETALRDAGIKAPNIGAVAVTATQQMPALIDDEDYFRLQEIKRETDYLDNTKLQLIIDRSDQAYDWQLRQQSSKLIIAEARSGGGATDGIKSFFREYASTTNIRLNDHGSWNCFSYLSPIFGPPIWQVPFPLSKLPKMLGTFEFSGAADSIMHTEVSVILAGIKVPGFFVFHHAAHAGSSFYSSPFEKAVILTNDGGIGLESGFVFFGDKQLIKPLGPHWLECGKLYEYMAERVGFDQLSGPGKLMGLSGYGKGKLVGLIPTGNGIDWQRWADSQNSSSTTTFDPGGGVPSHKAIFGALLARARAIGLSGPFTQLGEVPRELASELALATQALIEDTLLLTVSNIRIGLLDSRDGICPNALCLSGGVALNCPANTKIYNSGQFSDIYIEPYCDDGGLSIGAAQYAFHHILRKPRTSEGVLTSSDAMLGVRYPIDTQIQNIMPNYPGIEVNTSDTWWRDAAKDLAGNAVIGVFQSRSEAGPRALGHRSLLAHPGPYANWRRMNQVKEREPWRPFAPIILESKLRDWFKNGPDQSPFMLFTYNVDSAGERIAAVIHADYSSRVQTVTEVDGCIFNILLEFERLTGLPLLLNTSFNGRAEPIIETVEQAFSFFSRKPIDSLYIGKYIFKKSTAGGLVSQGGEGSRAFHL